MKKIAFLLVLIFLSGLQVVSAQVQHITGRVIAEEDGTSLPGVSVVIPGTNKGTTTDRNGMYSIEVTPQTGKLVFSFVGMESLEVEINGQEVINVKLKSIAIRVDEVIVAAYGVRKKESLTGSIQTVDLAKLEQVPVGSFENALQGTVAGVNVINSSGMPGSTAKIRIRGVGSISAGTDPLYVIDGVPVESKDFSMVNPNDIASISVLKDASATALYGSRAANGVIIISSKKGKSVGKTVITYRGQSGITTVARDKFDQMETSDKLDYEEYLGIKTPGNYDRESLEKINTNWLDELTRDGKMMSHEISVQGGSDKTTYYLSGGYYDETGVVPTSAFKRYSGKINLDTDAANWLKLGAYLTLGYEDVDNAITPDLSKEFQSNVFNPVFRSFLENPYNRLYREDGSYTSTADGLMEANPMEHLNLNTSGYNTTTLIGNFYADIKITEDLRFKSSLGGDFNDHIRSTYSSPESAWSQNTEGSVSRYFSRNFSLNNTNLFIYDKGIGKHSLKVFAGQENFRNYHEDFMAEGTGLPNDYVDVLGVTSVPANVDGDISEYSLISLLSSLNYNYLEKYYVDGSFRYDGASRFGTENRWAPFWSVAGMWDLKKENLLAALEILHRLKIKASYGSTGNWDIGNYSHLATYGYSTYMDQPAGVPSNPGNENLTWETTKMFNTGIEFGLLERLNIEFEYYHSVTKDMLFQVPLSFTSGFDKGWDNVGSLENRGVELTVDWDVIRAGDFKWNLNANAGYNQNEVTELYNDKEEIVGSTTITKVGESRGTYHLVRYGGVNPANGHVLWYDKDGNITSEFKSSDAVTLSGKSWYAPWAGGFTSTFEYGGLTLSAFFTWMVDRWIINQTRYFTENSDFASLNQSKKVLDYWKEPGDVTKYYDPGLRGQGQMQIDDRLLEDASFLRLKDITLAYSFPDKIVNKLPGVNQLKVYAKGYNLLTFTKYSGQDPEVNSNIDLGYFPHVKTISFGVDVGF